MSARPVAVLHLEDSSVDAKLIASALRQDGLHCDVTVVDNEPDYTTALESGRYDVILSDHALPSFDGLSALRLARALQPHVPFISVSGAFGEEAAVEILRAGATDFVLKHRLFRLGAAVRRALAEAEERTARARAEAEVQALGEQLRHAQRLEAIGRLAGGLSHDFNNLLTVINGYCEQALRRLPTSHELVPIITPILAAGQRGSDLTRRLLAFSRHQIMAPRVVSINDIANDLRSMLKPLLGERIALVFALDPRLGMVHVDPSQIEHVIMNLATNARDAMPSGGTMTIETHNLTLTAPRGQLPPGPYVELIVRDTGVGIDEEMQSHIFEPFFTTKDRAHGTGLGLATVYGIVAQSGGAITVDSAPGRGTAMRILLPYVAGERAHVAPAAVEEEGVPGGSETLLLVEDDENVRELVADFLRAAGYRVIEAGDAAEGEAKWRTEGRPIDLLVSDIVLPGLDGPGLAQRLRTFLPGLRTLLMSGYPGDAVVRPGPESGVTFLSKPFSRATLLRKVREALRDHP